MTAVAQQFAPFASPHRRWPMDKLREAAASQWIMPLCTILLVGITAAQIVFGAGGVLGVGAVNAGHLQKQLDDLTTQVSRLSDKIESGPRADQLREIERRISSIEGQNAANNTSNDSRFRAVEERVTRAITLIEGIDAASRTNLTSHPR
jgi:hypothetical protein